MQYMEKRGININTFLMDGNSSGCIRCTNINWTGIAYKIPRTALNSCKELDDLKQSGIYFLFGTSDDDELIVYVYVGQASERNNGKGLLGRLQEHARNPDKDYWTEAIVFTTSNNCFGPTEISYLENQFCCLAKAAKRYEVKNGNVPTQGNITEEKKCELERFVDYARIVMEVLGHKVLEPLVASTTMTGVATVSKDKQILYIKYKELKAKGCYTSEGFVVFKGSQVDPKLTTSCPDDVVKLRDQHKDKIDANHILTEDILFKSPSAAAKFVGGASLNGKDCWQVNE